MKTFALIGSIFLCTAPALAAEKKEKEPHFVVRPEHVLCDSFVGFGAQFNGWLYCAPNWGSGSDQVNERNVADLEKKVIDLAPQHVRVFVEIQPDSPQQSDPSVKASVIRTIALAQKAGATVNCTIWHGPYPDLGDAAQRMVDMMSDFLTNHHLTAVRYVTIQNEPNSFDMDKAKYNELYRQFDARLRKAGLREQIKIIGGDLLGGPSQMPWIQNLGDNLSDVCDGYSVHMYNDYWQQDFLSFRVPEITAMFRALPKEKQKPIYLTEFGIRGHRASDKIEPGVDEKGKLITDNPMCGAILGWRAVDALEHGWCALVYWDAYGVQYNRSIMPYGLIGDPTNGWALRPHYNLFRMFTHTNRPGWQVPRVDGQAEGVRVGALHRDSDWTVYLANRAGDKKEAELRIGGLPPATALHAYIWNADGAGKVAAGKDVTTDADGKFELKLPHNAIAAVTTLTMKP